MFFKDGGVSLNEQGSTHFCSSHAVSSAGSGEREREWRLCSVLKSEMSEEEDIGGSLALVRPARVDLNCMST